MNDTTIKNAIFALADMDMLILKSQESLSRLVAKRMPGLSEDDRQTWLTALDEDRKKTELLQATLRQILAAID
ncbi:MAG: hypothetical protein WC390_06570 [Sulfurimonas sp.]|jgi:hypothetical protein